MSLFTPRGLGWRPDVPDFRDYAPTPEHDEIWQLLLRLHPAPRGKRRVPSRVDLRRVDEAEMFTPVEDQGPLQSSTAFACLSLVEYFERRVFGRTLHASKLFLYQMTCKLQRSTGDNGADLRTTLKAMVRFGVPPQEFWAYNPGTFSEEPSDPFLFGFAEMYRSIRYLRLDQANAPGAETLRRMKSFLAAGFPVAFGFPVPSSLSTAGEIPYRPTFDSIRGGQSVVAVGYDDQKNTSPKGALLVRCSWGTTWGEQGYGWLPYAYVDHALAVSCWTLVAAEWTNNDIFLPAGITKSEESPQHEI
jgi:C1A family cysteine protease